MSSRGLPRRIVLNIVTDNQGAAVVRAVAVSGRQCITEGSGADLQAAVSDALAGMRAAARKGGAR